MSIKYNYFADVKRALYDEEYRSMLPLMKKAGVETLWLLIYTSGKYALLCR